ncbi:MAG: hypothetical protein IPM56_15440 [Ignavibacteriales bacterium]|nr:MAG: hypothetical protein IPM56_15440 [Ignavibacteriales bacterium]
MYQLIFNTILICLFCWGVWGITLAQQVIEASPIMTSDFVSYEYDPEDSIRFRNNSLVNFPTSSLGLIINDINLLNSNEKFIVHSIEFENLMQKIEKYKKYRRFFTYDEKLRTTTVQAEEFIDGKWVEDQRTEIIYDNFDNKSEINYKSSYQEIKIEYSYDWDNNLVTTEKEIKKNNEEQWQFYWGKEYEYSDGKMVGIKYDQNNEQSLGLPYCFKIIYSENTIETMSYDMKKENLKPRIKHLNVVDITGRPLDITKMKWSDSSWSTESVISYEYFDNGNISKIRSSYRPMDKSGNMLDVDVKNFNRLVSNYLYDENDNFVRCSQYKIESNDMDSTLFGLIDFYYDKQNQVSFVERSFENGGIFQLQEKHQYERDIYNNIVNIKTYLWSNNEWIIQKESKIEYKTK